MTNATPLNDPDHAPGASPDDSQPGDTTPLVIDLDGTVLRSDLLLETWLSFIREQPQRLLAPLRWLTRGKAALKHELAHATEIDVTALPYDEAVLAFIRTERARGRPVVLATASHHELAGRIAEHLALFDDVIATDAERNLAAHTKRDALVQSYGERGFDYAGNSRDDLPVWHAARKAYVANASAGSSARCSSCRASRA
jgi:phosphoserine phosphatase